MLPGYALTAHAFDEIAGLLAQHFRVLAFTPRGFGESDAPDSGEYSIATMVAKLVFLDAFPYFAEAGGDSIDALSPVPVHGFTGEMTHPRVREFLSTYRFGGWSAGFEADLSANELGPELMRRQDLTAGYVRDNRLHPPNRTQEVSGSHYVFFLRPSWTAEAIRQFLDEK